MNSFLFKTLAKIEAIYITFIYFMTLHQDSMTQGLISMDNLGNSFN